MYAIYGNIYHQYTPSIPKHIYHTWILWVIIQFLEAVIVNTAYAESILSEHGQQWDDGHVS